MVFYLNNRKVTNTEVGSIAVAVKNTFLFVVVVVVFFGFFFGGM